MFYLTNENMFTILLLNKISWSFWHTIMLISCVYSFGTTVAIIIPV